MENEIDWLRRAAEVRWGHERSVAAEPFRIALAAHLIRVRAARRDGSGDTAVGTVQT